MEKDRSFKMLAVVALVVAIAGVSIGFASYSRTFNITPTNVTVNGTGNKFNGTGLFISNVNVVGEGTVNVVSQGDINVGTDEDAAGSWTGMQVYFDDNTPAVGQTNPVSKATITATMNNATPYVAYLNSFALSNVLSCASASSEKPADKDVMDAFCSKVKVTAYHSGADSLKIYSTVAAKGDKLEVASEYNAAQVPRVPAATSGANGSATITVEIEVAGDAVYPDEAVVVTLPELTFGYTSAKTSMTK